jgi:CCR4-NOT transcription complex subunit 7/8
MQDFNGQYIEVSHQIIDVWANNLVEAMAQIRTLVDSYPYVAMDTEFPGVVARPVGNFSKSNYHYQTLRCNVDLLSLIQLGLTFSDEKGNSPPIPTWQFHFKFDISEEMFAQESIELLKRAGIDFKKHSSYGINVHDFGELLISSGLVLNKEVKWVAFHSGYDLGYLIKVLTCLPLPKNQKQFFDTVESFFPCIYDVKYMMKSCRNLKGGLQDLADELKIKRIGPQHQAGSDSLLTLHTFFKMKQLYFEDYIDDEKYGGVLYGLGLTWQPSDAYFENYSLSHHSNNNDQSRHIRMAHNSATN